MTKHAEFIHQRARVITGPGGTASHVAAPTETHSLTRPLACSVALHLGLATIVVVAGSAALVPLKAPRVAWLDLESADSPTPPHPAPVAATPRPRSAPRPIVEPRPIEPRQLPVPVTEGSVASPALPPPREVTALEPSPPAQSAPSPPQSAIVMGPSTAPEPDRSGASSSPSTSVSTSTDSRPARESQERSVNDSGGAAVASRPPNPFESPRVILRRCLTGLQRQFNLRSTHTA